MGEPWTTAPDAHCSAQQLLWFGGWHRPSAPSRARTSQEPREWAWEMCPPGRLGPPEEEHQECLKMRRRQQGLHQVVLPWVGLNPPQRELVSKRTRAWGAGSTRGGGAARAPRSARPPLSRPTLPRGAKSTRGGGEARAPRSARPPLSRPTLLRGAESTRGGGGARAPRSAWPPPRHPKRAWGALWARVGGGRRRCRRVSGMTMRVTGRVSRRWVCAHQGTKQSSPVGHVFAGLRTPRCRPEALSRRGHRFDQHPPRCGCNRVATSETGARNWWNAFLGPLPGRPPVSSHFTATHAPCLRVLAPTFAAPAGVASTGAAAAAAAAAVASAVVVVSAAAAAPAAAADATAGAVAAASAAKGRRDRQAVAALAPVAASSRRRGVCRRLLNGVRG